MVPSFFLPAPSRALGLWLPRSGLVEIVDAEEGRIRIAAVGESALSSSQSAETRRLVTPFNCS
jgi:hypothetical protein